MGNCSGKRAKDRSLLEQAQDAFQGKRAQNISTAAGDTWKDLKDAGFLRHFKEFNIELFRPLKNANDVSWDGFQKAAANYLLCRKTDGEAEVGFILFNGLAFWAGVGLSVFDALGGSYLSFAWNGGLSYLAAYSLYWMLVINKGKGYMTFALLLIVLYCVADVFATLSGLILIIPAAISGAKASLNVNMFIYGWKLYKQEHGGELPTEEVSKGYDKVKKLLV